MAPWAMAANAWRPERSTRVAVELKLAETLLTEPRAKASGWTD
jgi:hypothetical protein